MFIFTRWNTNMTHVLKWLYVSPIKKKKWEKMLLIGIDGISFLLGIDGKEKKCF